jgi:hypothetical protein
MELVGAEPMHAVDEAELASARPCVRGDHEQLRWKQQLAAEWARNGEQGCVRADRGLRTR